MNQDGDDHPHDDAAQTTRQIIGQPGHINRGQPDSRNAQIREDVADHAQELNRPEQDAQPALRRPQHDDAQ